MPITEDVNGFECPDLCGGKLERVIVDEEKGNAKWVCNNCKLVLEGGNGRAALWERIEKRHRDVVNEVINGKVEVSTEDWNELLAIGKKLTTEDKNICNIKAN